VHYDSLRVHKRTDVTGRILIVDDVVTKGSTALAAASRLAEVYPNADIRLFAAIRTKGMVSDIDRSRPSRRGRRVRHGVDAARRNEHRR